MRAVGALLDEVLVDQGELDAAEEALAPFDFEAEKGTLVAAILRVARGGLRAEQGRVAEAACCDGAIGAPKHESCSARRSTPPTV